MPTESWSSVRPPRLVTTIPELRFAWTESQSHGGQVGLVPTMGALHEGHLSLVRTARRECEHVVVTIFVNPTQFGPREDLAKYPRTFAADLEMLTHEAADLVFAPSADEIYPQGFSTYIEPPAVATTLEGTCRPGHFRGVATVVLKLFQLIPANVAYFGQKDYQQCQVIRRMVLDLNVPIRISMCPIVREADGLAMSSRNRYLSAAERRQATAISGALALGGQLIQGGERRASAVRAAMRNFLTDAGIQRIDYVAVADADDLSESEVIPPRAVLLIAAFVGETRLIDNCLL